MPKGAGKCVKNKMGRRPIGINCQYMPMWLWGLPGHHKVELPHSFYIVYMRETFSNNQRILFRGSRRSVKQINYIITVKRATERRCPPFTQSQYCQNARVFAQLGAWRTKLVFYLWRANDTSQFPADNGVLPFSWGKRLPPDLWGTTIFPDSWGLRLTSICGEGRFNLGQHVDFGTVIQFRQAFG